MRYQDLNSFNTAKETDTRSMFEGCEHLARLDLYSFDTSGVTCMMRMFADCHNIMTMIKGECEKPNVDNHGKY